MSELNFHYELLGPEMALAVTAALVMFADAFRRELGLSRVALPGLAVVGLVVALALSLIWIDVDRDFARLVQVDNFTTFFRVLFIAVTIVLIVGSHEYIERHVNHVGEFYGLLLFSTVGAMFMASARDLITAYLAIEVLSFSLYVMVSLAKNDPRSGEASLKYVLLGGVASAMLLYGLSLLYGVSGSTQYGEIAQGLSAAEGLELPLLLGLVLIIAGLGFKASAVPFHMWTPDAYEGAPIPVTAYLSATSKAATFALFLRWFSGPLLPALDDWQWMLAGLAAVTMVVGNLVALQQRNIKRLLAYSSIGQVGFMLMAITAISDETGSALLLHLSGYILTNLAVFMAVVAFYNRDEQGGNQRLPRSRPDQSLSRSRDHGRALLAGWDAAAGGLPHEVHPLPGGGDRGLHLAGRGRADREHRVALLLPAGDQADVPLPAGGRQ